MFLSPELSRDQLTNLSKHKYSCENNSVLDKYFQKWWQFVITLVPLWVAPNLLTIMGLLVNVVSSLLVFYYSPTAKEDIPSWALLTCGFGLFLYQTLDAIDGKQARRTNNLSAMGELFDHGCDSLSAVFVGLAASCCLQLGHYPALLLFQCIFVSTLFYYAHWQTYISGTMKFGYVDVTECQLLIMAVMSLTSVFGFQFWDRTILGVISYKFAVLTLSNILGIYNLISIPMRLFSDKNAPSSSQLSEISKPGVPLLLALLTVGAASVYNVQLLRAYPVLFVLTFALILVKITNALIVCHMTKSEMPSFDSILILPIIFFALTHFYGNNFILLCLLLISVSTYLFIYYSRVCLEICNHLNIYLFRI